MVPWAGNPHAALLVTQGSQGTGTAKPGLAQSFDLGKKTSPHHAIDSAVDERAQLVEWVVEDDDEETPRQQRQ